MAEQLDDMGEWGKVIVAVPPELMALNIAPDLQRFFDAMLYKLRRNAYKGRWETVPLNNALRAIYGEADELKKAIASGSTVEIVLEAADVANQALIASAIALEVRNV